MSTIGLWRILAALLTLLSMSASQDACDFETVKGCAIDLFYYDKDGLVFPDDEEKYLERCRHQLDAADCLLDYCNRCMEPKPRELMKALIRASQYQILEVCHPHGDAASRKAFKDTADCHNAIFPKLQSCAKDFSVNLDYAVDQGEQVIPRFCCAFTAYKACVVDASQECQQSDKDHFAIVVELYVGDMLGRVCSENPYGQDPSKCQEVPGIQRTGNEPRPNQIWSLIQISKAVAAAT